MKMTKAESTLGVIKYYGMYAMKSNEAIFSG
jgi:hypothetical protein